MESVASAIFALMIGLVIFWLVAGTQISLLIAFREIRLMAETLPQDKREAWLNDSLSSMNKGLKEKSAP